MANGEPRSFAPRILPSQSSSRHQALDSGSRLKRVADNIITNLTRKGTYEYDPIDCNNDIRILRIHHGPRGSELKCMLFPSALTSKSTHARHPYWALSYWWGEPNEVPKNKIRIFKDTGARDGKQVLTPLHKSDTFYIRDNLKAALERFRDPEEDVNVWVDAICINQNDKTEKNAQVSRMHEVYMQARNVCIWLGEGRDETEETFRFLQKILDLHQLDGLISDPKSNSPKWALVVGLMANRWFSRRWVIQELALSQQATVRWGKMELEWIHFADAIALFMTKYEEIKRTSLDPANYHKDLDARALGANTIIHATVNLFRKSPDGRVEQRLLPLEILVSSLLLAFEAGEPRDTIFAVLTLAKDSSFGTAGLEEDPRIAPDYKKPLLDVYTDFMDFCIEKSRSLDILCRYWAPLPKPEEAGGKRSPQDREESMPSWIPFITKSAFGEPHAVRGGRRNGDSLVGGPERKGQQTYNACGGVRSWHRFG
ncbi:heterokaryon incompatibility protein-domain-containing protein, partial [Xylogone sp. PMI_703]